MTRTRKPKSARAANIKKMQTAIDEIETVVKSRDSAEEDGTMIGDLSKLSDINEEIKEQIESKFAKLFSYYAQSFRFGRFPDWQFKGWQFIFHFGSLADRDMPHILLLGWKTVLLGVFKVKELPPEGQEIKGENIKGTILQGQIWFPFDRFGKL